VLTLETGVGQRRATTCLEWLLSRPVVCKRPYRPSFVLAAGFSGALRNGVRVGDIILATEVVDTQGRCWPATWPGELAAGDWPQRARLLTTTKLVGDPVEKRELGQASGAIAVDMEGGVIAEACTRAGVPFGCLRVISDDVSTALSPRLVTLLSGGRASALRIVAAVAQTPQLAVELWRLARHTRFAAAQLGLALSQLLTRTLLRVAQ
jgi:nucleoside phosphorylase